jgi:hypothetical protein
MEDNLFRREEPGVLAVPGPGPKHLREKVTDVRYLPKDELGREIVLLINCHPQLNLVFGVEVSVNTIGKIVKQLDTETKTKMLASLREALGIKPLKTRHLPYLGD